jgi:ASC-1-like (ASCH) protein
MEMHLEKIYFNAINDEKKIYETRVFDEKRQKLKLLDTITFIERGSTRTLNKKVIELAYFTNFEDAIKDVGIKKVLPNTRSLEEGVKLYESFSGFKEGAKKYGVLRIKF